MLRALSFSLTCALALTLASCGGSDAGAAHEESVHDATTQTVEVGCAKCSYSMPGVTQCENAVKIGEQTMLVTGEHGFDVMAEGICSNGVRQAEVTGGIQGDHFVATSIKLTN
jgi:predicted aldo/keto reductase-like oxidoreductase